ncbi:hypothetical protein AVEN_23266-1 [Araneus ventricosus]|uniref:FLYWCH-type domain-containing protein n=1 Tax=Araneus ventricosus TaxID=182803 RepID=A0A4Y2P3C9_ARAVE|nr:hypothetical protein AVEN_23266-1 [Araneus ventricosus]
MRKSIEIFEATKNKPSAAYNGYQYHKFRSNLENVITWRCINERSEKCKGILKTKDNCVVSEMTHSCKPNEAKRNKSRILGGEFVRLIYQSQKFIKKKCLLFFKGDMKF